MTPEKLKKNIELLSKKIARKPDKVELDTGFAVTFSESFTKYTRTRVVNLILAFNEILLELKWPFPAYILEFSYSGWRSIYLSKAALVFYSIVIKNKLINSLKAFNRSFTFSSTNTLNSPEVVNNHERHLAFFDDFLMLNFTFHEKEIFTTWRNNHLLSDKAYLIADIRQCYKKGLWYACIVASFPILDLLCRNVFKSDNLSKQITSMVRSFKDAGMTPRDLKPGYIAWEIATEKDNPLDKVSQNDLRLIGIGLGSFFDFAEIYYSYVKKDKATNELNRHAILHCASVSDDLWTKMNATKLLMFIDLTLRLEEPLSILLKED